MAQGFLSLTAFGAEGYGGGFAAIFKGPYGCYALPHIITGMEGFILLPEQGGRRLHVYLYAGRVILNDMKNDPMGCGQPASPMTHRKPFLFRCFPFFFSF